MKLSITFRTEPWTIILVMLSFLILDGCKGPEGPTGPAGAQGLSGPGSRKVYSGTIDSTATFSPGQVVSVPELNLTDFPLVAVYVSDNTATWIQLNLVVYSPSTQTFPISEVAFLQNQKVTIFSEQVGNPYRIVVVY
ncbi:MAG TPA: hypothetical protein VI758_03805 [Bacteroidota bacterium]